MHVAQVVASTYHLTIKFPIESGMGTILGEQNFSRECYALGVKIGQKYTLNS